MIVFFKSFLKEDLFHKSTKKINGNIYNKQSKKNSDCYMLLLDASKAFDRVEYVKLFSDLRERKLCSVVLRLLMNMYVNQCLQVTWNSLVSDRFSIANGMKQVGGGGIFVPNIFLVYTWIN